MESLLPPDATEIIIGAVLIAFHAYGRYNTPESNRSSTTRARFLACWLLYATSLVVLYWLTTVLAWISPEIVQKLLENTPSTDTGSVANLLRSPITTALLFTSLLPNFPLLRRLDRRLLQFFWDLGEIPAHAVKLAHRMYRSRFTVHPARLPEIGQHAKKYGIDTAGLDLANRNTLIFVWAILCSLILEIQHWNEGTNPHYKRFLEHRAAEFEEIEAEFAHFSSRVASHYRHLDVITSVRGQPLLSALLVQMSAAIGYADGVFERFERDALTNLIQALHMDEQKSMANCGLGSDVETKAYMAVT